jgi:hypothetical protein
MKYTNTILRVINITKIIFFNFIIIIIIIIIKMTYELDNGMSLGAVEEFEKQHHIHASKLVPRPSKIAIELEWVNYCCCFFCFFFNLFFHYYYNIIIIFVHYYYHYCHSYYL